MSKCYEWLWRRVGGRPWTYIIREWYHKYPLVWLLGLGTIAILLGVVLGHLFW